MTPLKISLRGVRATAIGDRIIIKPLLPMFSPAAKRQTTVQYAPPPFQRRQNVDNLRGTPLHATEQSGASAANTRKTVLALKSRSTRPL